MNIIYTMDELQKIIFFYFKKLAPVAQLDRGLATDQEVLGSNPNTIMIKFLNNFLLFIPFFLL